jgi:hypothetical protein
MQTDSKNYSHFLSTQTARGEVIDEDGGDVVGGNGQDDSPYVEDP